MRGCFDFFVLRAAFVEDADFDRVLKGLGLEMPLGFWTVVDVLEDVDAAL
jgi:hypothetical protein